MDQRMNIGRLAALAGVGTPTRDAIVAIVAIAAAAFLARVLGLAVGCVSSMF